MDGKTAVAKILKAEGVEFVSCFPFNPVLDAVAEEGIRLIATRTERVAVGLPSAGVTAFVWFKADRAVKMPFLLWHRLLPTLCLFSSCRQGPEGGIRSPPIFWHGKVTGLSASGQTGFNSQIKFPR